MFSLNLLSIQQKKDTRFEIYNRFLIHIGAALVLVLIIFAALLSPTLIFLFFEKSDLSRSLEVERNSKEMMHLNDIEKKIEGHNDLIRSLSSIRNGTRKVSPIVADVYEAAEGRVVIANFRYSLDEKAVEIKGNAALVKDFLDFKEAVESMSHFMEIISPAENVVRLRNVVFTLNAKLK